MTAYTSNQRGQELVSFRRNDRDRRGGTPVAVPGDRPAGRLRADELTPEAVEAHNALLTGRRPGEKGPRLQP